MGAGSSAIVVLVLVISGYAFNLVFHPFRYFANRAEGQKLFFMSAASGILLGALVFLFVSGLKPHLPSGSILLNIAEFVNRAIPVPYAFRIMATLASALVGAWLLNFVSVWLVGGGRPEQELIKSSSGAKAQRVYDRLTDRHGSAMAQLFRRAADKQKLVMLTLKSRKIYCGRIFEVPSNIDASDACIEILPSFSAYRDKDNLRMGEGRTEYPVIELWVARQRLYTLEQNLVLFDSNAQRLRSSATRDLRSPEMAEKLMRRVRRMLESQRREAEEVVSAFLFNRDIDVADWIKVISVKEIESASFYDPEAYTAWFAGGREAPIKAE